MPSKPSVVANLTRLTTFLQVATEGNLTRVAALAGSPQPFISRQIARLEADFGGKLFLRTGRGVVLTELGEQLLPTVRAFLLHAEALEQAVLTNRRTLGGEVTLGMLSSLYITVVVPLFVYVRQTHPDVRLRIIEGSVAQIDQWLSTGAVDIGVTYRYGKVSHEIEPLAQVSSYLVGPRGDPLTLTETVPFAALDGIPLVMPGSTSSVRLLLAKLAAQKGIRLNVVLETESGHIQRAITAHTGVRTVAALHAIEAERDAGDLQAARIVEPDIQRTVALGMTTSRPASPAAREIARQVRRLLSRPEVQAKLRSTSKAKPN